MEKVGHTPPKWWANDSDSAVMSDEGRICTVELRKAPTFNRPQEWHDKRQTENTRFIVRACNSHAALVAACRAAIDTISNAVRDRFDDDTPAEIVEEAVANHVTIKQLRAALAAAAGE